VRPWAEESDIPPERRNTIPGRMHACGHDGMSLIRPLSGSTLHIFCGVRWRLDGWIDKSGSGCAEKWTSGSTLHSSTFRLDVSTFRGIRRVVSVCR